MAQQRGYEAIVIGAGVFGAWTAYFLRKSGASVLLLDAYGPANARASSGGESRIIRMGYGADEVYTRWSMNALPKWKELFAQAGRPELFQQTGVLWIAHAGERYAADTMATLERVGVRFEKLALAQLRERYPQIYFEDDCWGVFERDSGVLMARRAVQTVVEHAKDEGTRYRCEAVRRPEGNRERLKEIITADGERFPAANFVFACGAWLPKLFPDVLGSRIFPSRQEVFYFGVPPGDSRFSAPSMPTWLKLKDEFYGMPDIENRGLKIAHDRHGVAVDPDTQSRAPTAEALTLAQEYVARRFPALRDAPVVETRVCQYENTSNGDFLIDRHPEMENVWLVGGGSGHGFKHGPSVGEYVAARVLNGGAIEPRFSLATKQVVQKRAVF
jgi:monomeric sarcosine oxidase